MPSRKAPPNRRSRAASTPRTTPNRVRFGEWTVDLDSAELLHNGQRIMIQQKPLQVLLMLLRRPGEVVTRSEISRSLWPASGGLADANLNTAIRKLRQALGDSPRDPRIVATVENKGYRLLVDSETPAAAITSEGPVRIAVTPLQNMSGPEFDSFADSLTEQMIAQLADPQGYVKLVVPVMAPRHRGPSFDVHEIARESGADYVLLGNMIRTGEMARITGRLIRSSDGAEVWSDNSSRLVLDIFRVQDEITLHIACSILQVIPKPAPLRKSTDSTPAYEDTVKGRHFAQKWNEPSFLRSLVCLEQAIAKEPTFARAHAGLARTYANMLHYGVQEPSSIHPKLQAAAARALELSPGLPEAIVAQGCAHLFYDCDWGAAEQSFTRALHSTPESGYACESYARLLIATGRHDESIAVAARARELNPLSPYSLTILGAAYCFARRPEEGLRPCLECIELEPGFSMAHAMLARNYEALGRSDEALESYRNMYECAPASAVLIANLAHGLAIFGHREEARQLLNKLLSMRRSAYVPGYWIALCYIGLGDHETGLKWLRTAVHEHCGWRVLAAVDPKLDPVRNLPEFIDMLRQIGFPQLIQ